MWDDKEEGEELSELFGELEKQTKTFQEKWKTLVEDFTLDVHTPDDIQVEKNNVTTLRDKEKTCVLLL